MSTIYVQYPQSGGTGNTTTNSISFSVGTLDGQAGSANGASISSASLFMQSATATIPGLISSASQTFSGVKTFNSAPNLNSLSASAVVLTDSSKNLSSGSVSLTSMVTDNLPISQTSGSVSLVNKVAGNLPLSQTSGSISLTTQVSGILPAANSSGLNLLSGSVSLTTQVVGILPAANLPVGTQIGSVSLTNQVSGILPAANLPAGTQIGSVSLTTQVSGVLPAANSSGLNLLVGSVSFSQMSPVPQFTIGSVTQTSSTGGAVYTIKWPGAQGTTSQAPTNDGSGNLSWTSILTNPFTTSGDIIVSSGTSTITRLAVGAGNQVLTVSSGSLIPSWQNPTAGTGVVTGTTGSTQFTSSGIYMAMAQGSISLTQGRWMLFGSIQFDNSGTTPTYTTAAGGWFAAPGTGTGTAPAALTLASNTTVLSVQRASGTMILDEPTTTADLAYIAMNTIYVSVAAGTTSIIYLVPFANMTTAANSRVTAYMNAVRLSPAP